MSIAFDIVIDSPEYAVDMKSGLETMQGVSDSSRHIAEAICLGRVVKRQRSESSIRTNLKETFKSSFGQVFSIDFYDEPSKEKFKKIGEDVFAEVIRYFMLEALYLETGELSTGAKKVIDDMGDNARALVVQLRQSSLKKLHAVSAKFNLDINVNHRKNDGATRNVLATFNRQTSTTLVTKKTGNVLDIYAAITRFNINTGNGRLYINGQEETVAFGFKKYREIKLAPKKIFTDNLGHNNGLTSEDWKYMRMQVETEQTREGKVVKYIIRKIYI
ncbi:hypothetical protein [Vibrio campbellii]|uniref:hypothetical protein n=1 Tax=Vibrio campbellii TaxID=680 RepID=UPI0005EEC142|nr:hypothetical protein [Vibrio campbellii]